MSLNLFNTFATFSFKLRKNCRCGLKDGMEALPSQAAEIHDASFATKWQHATKGLSTTQNYNIRKADVKTEWGENEDAHLFDTKQNPALYSIRKPNFLCFFMFWLFTIRVVDNLFACSLCIFGSRSASLSLLDWKRRLVFPKPPGLEMHAGWNPKPLITVKGIGWLGNHDS